MSHNALSFKKTPLLNKSSRLTFGQYKGQSVGEIMAFDASYLVWLAEKEIIQFEAWLLDDIYELALEREFQETLHREVKGLKGLIDWDD